MKSFHCPFLKSQKNQGFGRAYWSSFQNARGQAVIEYLLMVVISVTLVVALAFAMFRPLGDFIRDLNQRYIACLLETGELPGFRSEQQALCDEEKPQLRMTALDGRESVPGQVGPGSERPAGGTADTSGGESNVGGSAPRGFDRRSSVLRGGLVSRQTAKSDRGATSVSIPVDNFQEGDGYMSFNSDTRLARRAPKKTRTIALDGLTDYERRKAERQEKKSVSVPVESESFTANKTKKIVVKPPPPKEEADIEPLDRGFGFYFKVLLMFLILLFLFLLLGGQAFQLSKNWE
ncbi:MAG: hypothetical protein ACK5Y2_10100 [Bdellovibrionales bacterium]